MGTAHRFGPMTEMALAVTEDYSETEPATDEVDDVAEQLLAVWRVPGVVRLTPLTQVVSQIHREFEQRFSLRDFWIR